MLSGGENAGLKFDEFAEKYGQEGVFEMVLVACAKVVANFWGCVLLEEAAYSLVDPFPAKACGFCL